MDIYLMVFTNPDGYVHTHTSVSVGFDSSCYICKSILHASQVNTLWSFLSFWEKLWIHVLGQNMEKWQPCRLLSLFDLLVLTIRLAEVFVTEDQFHAKWTCCRQSPECPDSHNLRNETLWNWSQCNIYPGQPFKVSEKKTSDLRALHCSSYDSSSFIFIL